MGGKKTENGESDDLQRKDFKVMKEKKQLHIYG